MRLRTQRRLAAEILGVGENRIWMDPTRAEEISTAIRREDVKKLIKRGVIRARPKKGVSRGRVRERGKRRRGPGSREGATEPQKLKWMRRVRALRKTLSDLRNRKEITPAQYRRLYRMVKGGFFRDRGHLLSYLKEQGMIK
jgi:large subunit ribosomal protein L19e